MPNEYIRPSLVSYRPRLFTCLSIPFSLDLPFDRCLRPSSNFVATPPFPLLSFLSACSSEIIATPPIVSWWCGGLAQAQTRYLCYSKSGSAKGFSELAFQRSTSSSIDRVLVSSRLAIPGLLNSLFPRKGTFNFTR